MKKVKLVISFLLFLLFTSSQVKANCFPAAKSIPMHRKGDSYLCALFSTMCYGRAGSIDTDDKD